MARHLELIYYILAFAPGVTVNIYLVLMRIKYKNIFIGYFAYAYLGTSFLVLCYLINNILGLAGLTYLYRYIAVAESLSMAGIIWSAAMLIYKTFYDNQIKAVKYAVVILALAPVILYGAVLFGIIGSDMFGSAYYLFFIASVIALCALFLSKYRKINNPRFRRLGAVLAGILAFFAVIFVIQLILPKFRFDAFPLFYVIFTVQLILFGWRNFIASTAGGMVDVKKSFIDKYNITNRESEVMDLIRQGFSNSDIAKKLYLSEKTVANHIYNIYKKLGINSRFELICMFKE